jgi:S-(hydroxymethyl)glutathione dehydrogenase/alcohol dehydrogenase
VPFAALATLGCAVVTGVGAVMNAARVDAGSSVVVIGAGGVGLNVIQAARIAECKEIIAVDRHPKPLELAREFGATHLLETSADNAKQVRELTKERGSDYVFDTVGAHETISEALKFARKGGTVVVTGLFRTDSQASILTFPFVMHEKRLIGSLYGSGQPLKDIPKLVELYKEGKLKLDELVTRTYRLDEINDALAALAAGAGARGIIQW